MSDGRRKKSVNGGAPAQTNPDDRRSSLPELEASPPAGKRAVIKSADMKEDMQKEAIDIAITLPMPREVPETPTSLSWRAAIIYNKSHAWDDHWIFWVGPFIGAALAALYHQIVIRAIPFKSKK